MEPLALLRMMAWSSVIHLQVVYSSLPYFLQPDKNPYRCPVQVEARDGTQTIPGPSVLEDGNGVYTGPDRSALTSEGTVVMTRVCTFNLKGTAADTATAFEKVTVTYTSTATSVVVWF